MKRALVLFVLLATAAGAQHDWSGVERVVAVGDLHGDFAQFAALLEETGLVDGKQRWTGGKTHLVQVGDIPDRGPDTRKIMDLLMRLEGPAQKAGGRVHVLIGNHDAMNMYGDLRYATPEEFDAFRDGNSEQVRASFYEQQVRQLKQAAEPPAVDAAFRKQWLDEHPLGWFEHRMAFSPQGKYGKWIAGNNAMVKIGETLFVHGGVSPRVAAMDIGTVNETIRAELQDFSKLQTGLTLASDGPLWYRGLAQSAEEELAAHVDAALKAYGVKRIVIGHTPTAGTVIPRFGGRVLMIDVGLSGVYGSRRACLVIEKGVPYTLHRGKRIDLPDATPAGLLEYLKRAASLDPAPSPLNALIDGLALQLSAVSR